MRGVEPARCSSTSMARAKPSWASLFLWRAAQVAIPELFQSECPSRMHVFISLIRTLIRYSQEELENCSLLVFAFLGVTKLILLPQPKSSCQIMVGAHLAAECIGPEI